MKTCHKCGVVKELGEFHNDAKRKDGKYPKCKNCCKSYQDEYRRRNHEKLLDDKKRYYLNNSDKIIKYQAEYLHKNRDKVYARNARSFVKYRDSLSDSYVANVMSVKVSQSSHELIELKREQLLMHRATKQLIKEIENGTK